MCRMLLQTHALHASHDAVPIDRSHSTALQQIEIRAADLAFGARREMPTDEALGQAGHRNVMTRITAFGR